MKFYSKNFSVIIFYLVSSVTTQLLIRGDDCELPNGKLGVCTPIRECDWVREEITSKRMTLNDLPRYRCSFERNVELVCCTNSNSRNDKYKIGENRLGERPSLKACENYKNTKKIRLDYNIINGREAELEEYPHMAAIGYPTSNGAIEFRCGGSLISDRFILTAAHCVNIRVTSPTMVRLGAIDVDGKSLPDDPDPIDLGIESVKLHPFYVSNKQYHDIALIRLNQSVVFDNHIFPACLSLSTEDPPSNVQLHVTGWGVIDTLRHTTSKKLLEANLTIFDLEECKPKYSTSKKLPTGLNDGQLCAHDPINFSDSCQGDSGGPLQIIHELDNFIEIVGIVSIGLACGGETPGVYARVAYYLDWIESEVWAV